MVKAKKSMVAPGQSPGEAARERARARYQQILSHPAPEFRAAWEYWSEELGITAEDLKRIQDNAGIAAKERIGVTTLRRWIRGASTPTLAAVAKLTRALLGPNAHWHTDFLGRGLRLVEDLRFYDRLEARDRHREGGLPKIAPKGTADASAESPGGLPRSEGGGRGSDGTEE